MDYPENKTALPSEEDLEKGVYGVMGLVGKSTLPYYLSTKEIVDSLKVYRYSLAQVDEIREALNLCAEMEMRRIKG